MHIVASFENEMVHLKVYPNKRISFKIFILFLSVFLKIFISCILLLLRKCCCKAFWRKFGILEQLQLYFQPNCHYHFLHFLSVVLLLSTEV